MKNETKKNIFVYRKHKQIASLVRGHRILDIGCCQAPNPYLKDPIGIDIQHESCPNNYKRLDCVNLNVEPLPYSDSSFDTVIISDVIEHLENPSFVLREINRVLIDGGKMILATPHANHWETILRNWFFSYLPDPDKGEHINNWTRQDMIRLMKLNGFKAIRQWGTWLCKSIPIYIPVTNFPILGWIIIYETIKYGKPVKSILTNKSNGAKVHIMQS